MKKSILTALTIGCMILGITTTASAFGPKHHGNDFDRGKCWEELDLSADQEKQIKQIKSDFKEANKDTVKAMKAARKDLHELMRASEPDTAAIKAANAKVNSLKETLMLARLEMRGEMKSILTPEQIEKMEEMRDERDCRGHDGYGKRGKGDRPCKS